MFKNYALLFFSIFAITACSKQDDDSIAMSNEQSVVEKNHTTKSNAQNGEEYRNPQNKVQDASKPLQVQTRNFNIEPDDIVLGNTNSKIIFLEYFSPTCPHCAIYHKKIFPEIKEKYIDTGRIAYVIREFIGNKQDLDATILAHCDGFTQSYLNFMHVILERQSVWAAAKDYRDILTNIGSLGGVSPEKYAACLKDESRMQIFIENSKLVARQPHFAGTPSFFINGKQFTKPYTVEELSKAIEEESTAVETNNSTDPK